LEPVGNSAASTEGEVRKCVMAIRHKLSLWFSADNVI
jgi:hypothetical protein